MFGGKKNKWEQEGAVFTTEEGELVRVDQRRTSRWVWCGVWSVLIIGIIISIYFLGKSTLDLVLEKIVYTNNMFTVRTIDVRTVGGLSKERVLEFLSVQPGKDNLMALNLGEIKERLEKVSVIERAGVGRSLPDTLEVQVYARVPILRCYVWESDPTSMTLTNGNWAVRYIDNQGYVMVPDDLFYEVHAPEQLMLPMLTGVSEKNMLVPNRLCGEQQVLDALKFLKLYKRSSFYGKDQISELNIGEPDFIIVRTAEGVEAVVDVNDMELGLARWKAIESYGAGVEQKIRTIDVSVTNNVAVVWAPSLQTNVLKNRLKDEKNSRGR